jgi:hypothetical protein
MTTTIYFRFGAYYDALRSSKQPFRHHVRETSMANDGQTAWYHSNRYHAAAACECCRGIVRHEPWCITANPRVQYAYQVVVDASKLTQEDVLILHSLGVIWGDKVCKGACRQ